MARSKYTYHKDGTLPAPEDGYIFVFGSNLAGLHGAGAALVAKRCYGAEQGVGRGMTGSAYAVPTKDRFIRSLTLTEIRKNIQDFVLFALDHPEHKFFVTRTACRLAGYKNYEIAPMYRGASSNCSFPEPWRPFLR